MTKKIVTGEEIFQIPSRDFAISPSAASYVLNYSADGLNFTAWGDATAAGTNEVVVNAPVGMFFKLAGNASAVTVIY